MLEWSPWFRKLHVQTFKITCGDLRETACHCRPVGVPEKWVYAVLVLSKSKILLFGYVSILKYLKLSHYSFSIAWQARPIKMLGTHNWHTSIWGAG